MLLKIHLKIATKEHELRIQNVTLNVTAYVVASGRSRKRTKRFTHLKMSLLVLIEVVYHFCSNTTWKKSF